MAEQQLTQEAANEQVILGSLLINKEIRDTFAYEITPEDFTYPNHKCFAYAINHAYNEGLTITTDIIYELAKQYNPKKLDTNKMNEMVNYDYITDLIERGKNQNINSGSFKYYIERIRYRTLAFDTIWEQTTKLDRLLKSSDSKYEDALKLIDSIRDKFILSKVGKDGGYRSIDIFIPGWREEFEIRKKGRKFVPIGYIPIDYNLTEGLAMGKVSIIAGRPGSGKSSLVANVMDRISIMSNMAVMGNVGPPISPFVLNKPIPCALCALEMNSISTIDRLLSIRTKVPLTDIIRNPAFLNKKDLKLLDTFIVDFSDHPSLYIDDAPRQDLDILAQNISRLKRKIKSDELIVFIDLFGKLEDMNENVTTTTAAAYENTLRRVQILARDLNVHFCLVAQISRMAEGSGRTKKNKIINNRPTFRHLKHSGAFEEVADLILLLYRPKYYQQTILYDLCEVHIAKQRQGLAGKVINLKFEGHTTTLKTTKLDVAEQTAMNLNLMTENDFSADDKHLYYSELSIEERQE